MEGPPPLEPARASYTPTPGKEVNTMAKDRMDVLNLLRKEAHDTDIKFSVFQSTQQSTVLMGGRFGCNWG